MATDGSTTPRERRKRARSMGIVSVHGSVGPVSMTDNSDAGALSKHRLIVDDLVKRATNGEVSVKVERTTALLRSEFILTLNSLEYDEKIRAAVRELSLPWETEYTETKGFRDNPNSIYADRKEEGFPTLIIVRRGLYVPETRTCTIVFAGVGLVLGFIVATLFFYWLLTLKSDN